MKNFKLSFFLFIILISCQKDEEVIRVFPRLLTQEVSEINSEGALFTGELISMGSSPIIEYGFVWGPYEDPTIKYSEIVSSKSQPTENYYSMIVEHALKQDETYFVKSFAKNDDYITYGNVTSFVSLGSKSPIITDFEPKAGLIGDSLIIYGKHFAKSKNDVKVEFNDNYAVILSTNDSVIITRVPHITEVENLIKVSVLEKTIVAEEKFMLKVPEILSLSPKQGKVGDIITITGNNLMVDNIGQNIYLGDELVEVISADDRQIKIKAPSINVLLPSSMYTREELLSKKIKIVGDIIVSESADNFFYLFPTIDDVNPKIATLGDTVSIEGESFVSLGYDQSIYFGNTEIEEIFMNDSQIKIVVPSQFSDQLLVSYYIELRIGETIIKSKGNYSNDPSGNTKTIFDEVSFGDNVIVYFDKIDGTTNDISVALTDEDAKLLELGIGYLKFEVPFENLYEIEMVKIRIGSETYTLEEELKIKSPEIINAIPSSVSYGETVTLIGSGFSPSLNYCYMRVLNMSAPIISASFDQLSFIMPNGVQEEGGKIEIQYIANAVYSNVYNELQLK